MKQDLIRNEIGSEFWDIPTIETKNGLFPEHTRWFISGTAALEYIIGDIQKGSRIKKAGVPSWCCSCMIQPFVNAGIDVSFYSVYPDEKKTLVCDYTAAKECDVTLVLSYFGYEQCTTVEKPGGIVIRDLTHSIFCPKHDDARYYFGSLRKWAGFWTGGYAWKDTDWQNDQTLIPAEDSYLQMRRSAMESKLQYLKGITDEKDYLSVFEETEDFLDCCGVQGSCDRDIQCAQHLDTDAVRTRRRANAAVLLTELRDVALFPEIQANDCPMFVPILLPEADRDGLRRYLISKEIYCPIHWPVSDLHVLNDRERYLYDHSLSIVCDQRYDTDDMRRIANAIREYFV